MDGGGGLAWKTENGTVRARLLFPSLIQCHDGRLSPAGGASETPALPSEKLVLSVSSSLSWATGVERGEGSVGGSDRKAGGQAGRAW